MAITNGYCTLIEFKAYCEITSTNTGDDAVLEQIIEAVSRFIDKDTYLIFYDDQDAARYYSAELGDFLRLDRPLQTVTSLKTDPGGDGTFEDEWESTDFHLMPLNADEGGSYHWIELAAGGSYSLPVGILKGIEITGDWGYSAVPVDIKMCCMEIAKNVEGRRHGQGTEAVQITAAGVMITPKDITPYARSVLDKWRRNR